MGMGEPLANYRASIGAVRRLTDPAPDGLGLSARGITVSTVGLVPAIDQLAGERAAGDAGAEPARARRRAARRARPDEHPVDGRRGARRGRALLRRDRPPGEHRVRADPRRQRPGLARRPARPRCSPSAAAAGCTSTRSRSTRRPGRSWTASDPAVEREFVRRCARTASRRRCATPVGARSTAPAASWPRARSSAGSLTSWRR